MYFTIANASADSWTSAPSPTAASAAAAKVPMALPQAVSTACLRP